MTMQGHAWWSTRHAPNVNQMAGTKDSDRTMRRECPFAQRVWIALLEKGMKFDKQEVDLREDNGGLEGLASPCPGSSSACSQHRVHYLHATSPVHLHATSVQAQLKFTRCISFIPLQQAAACTSQSLVARGDFHQGNYRSRL